MKRDQRMARRPKTASQKMDTQTCVGLVVVGVFAAALLFVRFLFGG